MSYIFLDESGEFRKDHDRDYFIIGSFATGNAKRTSKSFLSWQQSKFPKIRRYQGEVKFGDRRINNEVRLKTLQHIADLDVKIHYSYLFVENIPEEYRDKQRIKSGFLYAHMVEELLEQYLPISDGEFRLFYDRRYLKDVPQQTFHELLKTGLLPHLGPSVRIQIEGVDSTTNPNIQIADWISGALARYHNKGELGEECYAILKQNLIHGTGMELFKDHWLSKQKTQP